MKKQEIEARRRYARIPSLASEFAEWEPEQVWLDNEEGEPEEATQQCATTGEGTNAMKEALEKAAEIRHSLEGRRHSDSIQDLRKDRQRLEPMSKIQSMTSQMATISGSTPANHHSMRFGTIPRTMCMPSCSNLMGEKRFACSKL